MTTPWLFKFHFLFFWILHVQSTIIVDRPCYHGHQYHLFNLKIEVMSIWFHRDTLRYKHSKSPQNINKWASDFLNVILFKSILIALTLTAAITNICYQLEGECFTLINGRILTTSFMNYSSKFIPISFYIRWKPPITWLFLDKF